MRFIIYLLFAIFLMLILGTVVYHNLEEWSWIDSLYFTTSTMFTVGYGDIAPTNETTRLFTVFFIFISIGVVLYTAGYIFERILEQGIAKRFSKKVMNLGVRREQRWNFGGRNKTAFKLKNFFKDLGEKIKKLWN